MERLKKCLFLFFIINICLMGVKTVYAADKLVTGVSGPGVVPAVAVQAGGNGQEIVQNLNTVTVTIRTAEESKKIAVTWDLSAVKFDSIGVYPVYGSVKLPEGYVLGTGVELPKPETTVSVQSNDVPEINSYYRISESETFIFPWLKRNDTSKMSAWLMKEGGDWANISASGGAVCKGDGLYLSGRCMILGNTYYLVVKYEKGYTKILKFVYGMDKNIKLISYTSNYMGQTEVPFTRISSCETVDEKLFERSYAVALAAGEDLGKTLKMLDEMTAFKVSVSENYEDTLENPAITLTCKWDTSEVDVNTPGVYKIVGTFQIPEGYTVKSGLELPEVVVYVSVQKTGNPQINTYYMLTDGIYYFPMNLNGLLAADVYEMRIFLKKQDETYLEVEREYINIEGNGIQIDLSEYLQTGCSYEMYARYADRATGIYSFTYDGTSLINELWAENSGLEENPEGSLDGEDLDGDGIPDGEDPDDSMDGEDLDGDGIPDGEDSEGEDLLDGDDSGSDYSGGYSYYSSSGYSDSSDTYTSSSYVSSSTESDSLVRKISDETTSIISGKDLQQLIDGAGNTVEFEKSNISVQIPESVARSWAVKENEEVEIRIQKTADAAFSVRIFVRDEEIHEVPGTVVSVREKDFYVPGEPKDVKVVDKDNVVSESSYSDSKGVWEIIINKTGDYFMENGAGLTEESVSGMEGEDEFTSDELLEDDMLDAEFLDDDMMSDEEFLDEDMMSEEFLDDDMLLEEEFLEDDMMLDEELLEDDMMPDEEFYDDEFVEGIATGGDIEGDSADTGTLGEKIAAIWNKIVDFFKKLPEMIKEFPEVLKKLPGGEILYQHKEITIGAAAAVIILVIIAIISGSKKRRKKKAAKGGNS